MFEIAALVVLSLAGFSVLRVARNAAVNDRASRLKSRRMTFDEDWFSQNQHLESSMVLEVLNLCADELEVERKHLKPTDSFNSELVLRGYLLIDENVCADLRERLLESYEHLSWNEKWATLGDVVFGVSEQLTRTPPDAPE